MKSEMLLLQTVLGALQFCYVSSYVSWYLFTCVMYLLLMFCIVLHMYLIPSVMYLITKPIYHSDWYIGIVLKS